MRPVPFLIVAPLALAAGCAANPPSAPPPATPNRQAVSAPAAQSGASVLWDAVDKQIFLDKSLD
jgi:hypothetical protein